MWKKHNENPAGRNVGDCTVRAISAAMEQDWDMTYLWLCMYGFLMKDMPSANAVWGAYLKSRGWRRRMLPDECPDCYTVEEFCREHPRGVYILALGSHVLCVRDGEYLDTWESGQEIPIYYWQKED